MKLVLVLALSSLVGCAKGSSSLVGNNDAPSNNNGDPDALVYLDSGVTHDDAKVYDDAKIYEDAKIYDDAKIYEDAKEYRDACIPVVTELLLNPVFDLAPMGTDWTNMPLDAAYPDITNNANFTPQSTPYYVWMGGFSGEDLGTENSVTDFLYQDVTIPAGTTSLVLTGYDVVGTTEDNSAGIAYDTGTVEIIQTNGTHIETALSLSNLSDDGTSPYKAFSHTFAANLSGQTVRFQLTTTNDFSNYTNFFFDTFALKATHCP